MERLKQVALPSSFGYGLNARVDPSLRSSWYISGDLIYIPTPSEVVARHTRSWMEMALKQVKVDIDAIGAEAYFKEIVLYRPGGHYVRHRLLAEEPGLNW